MAYNASNPGPIKEITAPESDTIYRGFIALEETTMAFVSGGNAISSTTFAAGFQCGCQIDSVTAITGKIGAFTIEPNAGHAS